MTQEELRINFSMLTELSDKRLALVDKSIDAMKERFEVMEATMEKTLRRIEWEFIFALTITTLVAFK